jgi:hypothetical protein
VLGMGRYMRVYAGIPNFLFLNFIPALLFSKNIYLYGMFLNNASSKLDIQKIICSQRRIRTALDIERKASCGS